MRTNEVKPARLCVFFVHHIYDGEMASKFRKEHKVEEFPDVMSPDLAIELVYEKYGRPEPRTTSASIYHDYAKVFSNSVIPAYERAKIETWTASQEGLFSGPEWIQTLSERPK